MRVSRRNARSRARCETRNEGDILRFSGEGCVLDNLFVAVVVPNGSDLLGPGCRAGTTFVLKQSGVHQLVVNSTDSGEGPYHFVLQGAKGK
jgi:hypothetical protein